VISDEQSHTRVAAPVAKHSYMLNVAGYQNGVGYGQGWTANISGFSENVVRFITVLEGLNGADQPTEPAT
jgi:60 kDa SS-A/Ro ribonucleoprotein